MARQIEPFSPEERMAASVAFLSLYGCLDYLSDKELSRFVELIRLEQMDREDNKIEAYYSGNEIQAPVIKIKGEVNV